MDWANPEYANKHRKLLSSNEIREKNQKAALKRWADENFKDKMNKLFSSTEYREKVCEGLKRAPMAPNNFESYFQSIVPETVRYVGGGDFWVKLENGNCRNPDFKVTGQRKLIELWGDYWHRNDDPFALIELYWRKGFECLLFWESDVHKNSAAVAQMVRAFIDDSDDIHAVITA